MSRTDDLPSKEPLTIEEAIELAKDGLLVPNEWLEPPLVWGVNEDGEPGWVRRWPMYPDLPRSF